MPNLSKTVTFLFASDGSLASEGLSVFLQTKSNFLMVAECSDGASAIAGIEAHDPDIAVIDAQLADMNAMQIIEAIQAQKREIKIIVLGASADRQTADEFLAAGADAYVVRSGPSRHLNDAIRFVRDGGKYLAPELTKDIPVSDASAAGSASTGNHQAVNSLRAAIGAQAQTVERLEKAMERTQRAIELLQQKVEQLSSSPVEPPSATPAQFVEDGAVPSRKVAAMRSGVGAVAAALIVGVLGFLLAGVLRPAPESPVAEFSSAGAEDALKSGSTLSLHLEMWETETVERATALLKNQEYAAAEKLCRNLLKQDPSNIAASRLLASALFHENRIEESADVVRSIAVPETRASRKPTSGVTSQN